MKNKKYTFKDLEFGQHRGLPNAVQAIMVFDNGHRISVVGGDGLYGDGVNTFEIWRSIDGDVKGHLTPDEVTDEMIHLQKVSSNTPRNEFGY